MTKAKTPTEPPVAESAPAPYTLQITMPLPDGIAEFGLAEQIVLPAAIFDQWGDLGELIQQAVMRQAQQAAWSLATSLNAVLEMRAETGAPLTHETYIARQEVLLAEREAAAAAATSSTRALAEESRS